MHHDEFGSDELDPVQRHGVRPVAFADGGNLMPFQRYGNRKRTHQVVANLTAGRPIGPLALSATGKLRVGEGWNAAADVARQLIRQRISAVSLRRISRSQFKALKCWSERGDSNSRPLAPEQTTLPKNLCDSVRVEAGWFRFVSVVFTPMRPPRAPRSRC